MERRRGGPPRSTYIVLAVSSGVLGVVLVAVSLAASAESSGSSSVLLPGILLLVIGAVNIALALGLVGAPHPTASPHSTPDALRGEVTRLLQDGRKLEAIKAYRQATGVGLAEAKEAVERIEAELRSESDQA